MDGYELVRRLRREYPAPVKDLPAVALTAFARPADRGRALEAGFGQHVVKPVEASKLVAAVARLLGQASGEHEERQSTMPSAEAGARR
jgi:CheY-like chemotaxis protein